MHRAIARLLGLPLIANGLAMLSIPGTWYAVVPGVSATGAFNPHFVRDIGVAYVVTGAALTWFASSVVARPAALIAAAFLALHALVHLWDVAAGREQLDHLLTDIPTVFLPPVLAIWIIWASGRRQERRRPILRWFLRRQIAAFERTWNYDASYLCELVEGDPGAMLAVGKLRAISGYRKDVPPAVYCAAGLVAGMAEDCGPCTQLGITIAERGGITPAVLRAIVAREFTAMPDDVALGAFHGSNVAPRSRRR